MTVANAVAGRTERTSAQESKKENTRFILTPHFLLVCLGRCRNQGECQRKTKGPCQYSSFHVHFLLFSPFSLVRAAEILFSHRTPRGAGGSLAPLEGAGKNKNAVQGLSLHDTFPANCRCTRCPRECTENGYDKTQCFARSLQGKTLASKGEKLYNIVRAVRPVAVV